MVLALKTESHMAECEFYQTVESSAPEFKYIANRLVDLTKGHINKLQRAATPLIEEASKKKDEALHERDQKLGTRQKGDKWFG